MNAKRIIDEFYSLQALRESAIYLLLKIEKKSGERKLSIIKKMLGVRK